MKKIFLLITILSGILAQGQIKIPEKPSFIPPIIDSTHTLDESQKNQLYQKLKIYSDSTSTEVLVMLVATTQGEDAARYATDLGQKWQIGQKGKDNGIIVLIAKDDRKMTIQTGYGIEHLLTDALSRRIIEQEFKPNFKSGNYYEGIDQGTSAIFKVMKGEYKGEPESKGEGSGFIFFIFIVILILLMIFKNKGNRNGGRGGGLDLGDIIILSSLGRGNGGSSWGGSSGGSDWGGFGGGGSFGGGGASGDW